MKSSDILDDSVQGLGRVIALSRPRSFTYTSNVAPKYLVFKYHGRYLCAISQIPEPASVLQFCPAIACKWQLSDNCSTKTGRKGKKYRRTACHRFLSNRFSFGGRVQLAMFLRIELLRNSLAHRNAM